MASVGLNEFKSVISDFKKLNSLALKGAIVAPLIDLWLQVGPMPSKPAAVLSSLVEFIVVIWVFQFLYQADERKLKLGMNAALILFSAAMFMSLILLWTFSIAPNQSRQRVVEGYSLREDVRPLINDSYTAEEALRESAYDASKVWTKSSIVIVTLLISVTWIAAFASFAFYLTVFIVLQRRRSKLRPSRH
jgi:hypothetical protein